MADKGHAVAVGKDESRGVRLRVSNFLEEVSSHFSHAQPVFPHDTPRISPRFTASAEGVAGHGSQSMRPPRAFLLAVPE